MFISLFTSSLSIACVRASVFEFKTTCVPSSQAFNALESIGDDPIPTQGGDLSPGILFNYLRIATNPLLALIDGFEALERVEGAFLITENDQLVAAQGFDALESIGGDLQIERNPNLNVIPAFQALQTIENNLSIEQTGLIDIPAFNTLSSLPNGGILIRFNEGLEVRR